MIISLKLDSNVKKSGLQSIYFYASLGKSGRVGQIRKKVYVGLAQNMYKSFFDLVDEANSDGVVDVSDILDLMKNFSLMKPQLKKVYTALQ